jgi:hypothetical protein
MVASLAFTGLASILMLRRGEHEWWIVLLIGFGFAAFLGGALVWLMRDMRKKNDWAAKLDRLLLPYYTLRRKRGA